MVVEPEFASVLAVAERQATPFRRSCAAHGMATSSHHDQEHAVVRDRRAHLDVGHITADELRARITRTDMANGFANRFLFALVKRSKLLPFGGDDWTTARSAARGTVAGGGRVRRGRRPRR